MERKEAIELFGQIKAHNTFSDYKLWDKVCEFERFNKREIKSYKLNSLAYIFESIEKSEGSNAAGICKKLVLLHCLLKNWNDFFSDKYPLSIQVEFKRNFDRMHDLCQQDYGWDNLKEDIYWKDLGIVRQHVFPFGPGVVDAYSGFGLRQGMTKNIKDSFFFLMLMTQLGGRKGYYQTHAHTPLFSDFNEAGWIKGYKRIGEMLAINKHIKGLISCNWFRDPKLKEITPGLSYLREIPIKNGAKVFYAGEDQSKNALVNSLPRTKLYKEGKYIPQLYLMIWPRSKLIEFAK